MIFLLTFHDFVQFEQKIHWKKGISLLYVCAHVLVSFIDIYSVDVEIYNQLTC